MKDRLGRPIKEYRLSNKYGASLYYTGTKAEVADYALRNQLLIEKEDEDE